MHVLERFYGAFSKRDPLVMGACYHRDAHFSDPVFPDLNRAGVQAMWAMLLKGGGDLRIAYRVVEAGEDRGRVQWEAWYTFSTTGRKVHNIVASEFTLKEGLILVQQDRFDLWRWSRQALGLPGVLLGWTPLVRNKVRAMAAKRLERAMQPGP